MATKRDLSRDKKYLAWLATENIPKYSASKQKKIDDDIKRIVDKEFKFLKVLDAKDYALVLKHQEINSWLPKQSVKDIEWVKRLIWKPIGKSDYRRIEPELIVLRNELSFKTFNIWGEENTKTIKNNESLSKHWEILKTLISRSPNDGTLGRQLHFIVRDKNTKMYLGALCISSAMYRIRSIHDEIGWDRSKNMSKGGKLVCLANGQTIVPTQPFGRAYLGGKLLSLLCLSKEVAQAWEDAYGDKLVGVHTTSLWGSDDGTQYDNLEPYWKKIEQSSGSAVLKPRNNIYELMIDWMKQKYPQDYYRHYIEKTPEGNPMLRENKSRAIEFCYRKLGITRKEYESGFPKGVYSAFLYKNSKEYLRDEIGANELVPAYDNSIEALTNHWKFGSMGDTTKATEEMLRKEKKPSRLKMKIKMKGFTKGNLDARFKEGNIPLEGEGIDWYEYLIGLPISKVLEKYPDQLDLNKK